MQDLDDICGLQAHRTLRKDHNNIVLIVTCSRMQTEHIQIR